VQNPLAPTPTHGYKLVEHGYFASHSSTLMMNELSRLLSDFGKCRRSCEHVDEGLWTTLHCKPVAELVEEDHATSVLVNVAELSPEVAL